MPFQCIAVVVVVTLGVGYASLVRLSQVAWQARPAGPLCKHPGARRIPDIVRFTRAGALWAFVAASKLTNFSLSRPVQFTAKQTNS
jgi:hypothetical protein